MSGNRRRRSSSDEEYSCPPLPPANPRPFGPRAPQHEFTFNHPNNLFMGNPFATNPLLPGQGRGRGGSPLSNFSVPTIPTTRQSSPLSNFAVGPGFMSPSAPATRHVFVPTTTSPTLGNFSVAGMQQSPGSASSSAGSPATHVFYPQGQSPPDNFALSGFNLQSPGSSSSSAGSPATHVFYPQGQNSPNNFSLAGFGLQSPGSSSAGSPQTTMFLSPGTPASSGTGSPASHTFAPRPRGTSPMRPRHPNSTRVRNVRPRLAAPQPQPQSADDRFFEQFSLGGMPENPFNLTGSSSGGQSLTQWPVVQHTPLNPFRPGEFVGDLPGQQDPNLPVQYTYQALDEDDEDDPMNEQC